MTKDRREEKTSKGCLLNSAWQESLVPVPLLRGTGLLLGCEVPVSLWCWPWERKKKKPMVPSSSHCHYPANRDAFSWSSGQKDGILLEFLQSTPTDQFPDLGHLQLRARR